MLYKRYVEMMEYVSTDGTIIPKILIWENGAQYPIDRVLEVKKAASSVGGCGVLYKCRIQGQVKHLFREKDRWFVESKRP